MLQFIHQQYFNITRTKDCTINNTRRSRAARISTWGREDDLGREKILHPQHRNPRAKFILRSLWLEGTRIPNRQHIKGPRETQFLSERDSWATHLCTCPYTPFLVDARKESTLPLRSNRHNYISKQIRGVGYLNGKHSSELHPEVKEKLKSFVALSCILFRHENCTPARKSTLCDSIYTERELRKDLSCYLSHRKPDASLEISNLLSNIISLISKLRMSGFHCTLEET